MAVKRNPRDKIVVDLDGPEGNAFALFSLIMSIEGKQRGSEIMQELMAGDYYGIIQFINENYGSAVELYTEQEELLERFAEEG